MHYLLLWKIQSSRSSYNYQLYCTPCFVDYRNLSGRRERFSPSLQSHKLARLRLLGTLRLRCRWPPVQLTAANDPGLLTLSVNYLASARARCHLMGASASAAPGLVVPILRLVISPPAETAEASEASDDTRASSLWQQLLPLRLPAPNASLSRRAFVCQR